MASSLSVSDVIVIGGGIVGASAAYRLARDGMRVTLVDRADQGQATAAGAGIISPGTSLRPLPAFFALGLPALAYYDRMLIELAEDGETQTGYERVGMLHVAMTHEEEARLDGVQALYEERKAAGFADIGVLSRLRAQEARALFPPLAEVRGAIHTTGAARVDGRLLRDALRRAAEKHGARVLYGSAELVREGNRATEVRIEGDVLSAGAVVIAGGAWSSAFALALGMDLPVYPQRGQILHMEMPHVETKRWPIVTGFHSHYVLTFPPDRVVAGATREDGSGFDYRLTVGGVHEVLSEALRVAPGLAAATVSELRIGLRPASPDGVPILGRAPTVSNVYLATGHGPSGLQLGPYSGALVANLVRGGSPPPGLDMAPYAPERFQSR
jgi:D-amino-acid dehydrogenase